MDRRPNMREGLLAPELGAGSAAVLGAGVLARVAQQWLPWPVVSEVGTWLIIAGALGLVTTLAIAVRAGRALLIMTPLWVGFAGVLAVRVGVPGAAGSWLIAAACLYVASAVLVMINRPIGAGVAAGAWLVFTGLVLRTVPAAGEAHRWWWAAVALGGLVALGTVARAVFSRSSSRGLLRRLGRAGRESDGLATGFDVWRTAGRRVLRRQMRQLRPSLAAQPLHARVRVRSDELGVRIGRVGAVKVWAPSNTHTFVAGGPRMGKTQLTTNFILDAPGAVITTSTKQDVLVDTAAERAQVGPVWVFDPSGIIRPAAPGAAAGAGESGRVHALVESLGGQFVRFDPLRGCEAAEVAMDRAADLISGASTAEDSGKGERWDGFAKQVLQALLQAAALGPWSMADVKEWVSGTPDKTVADEVIDILESAGQGGLVANARHFFSNNNETRTSITTSIMPALEWLAVPSAAAAAAPGGQQFDVAQLLAEGGTVYILGAQDKKTAPLVTAMTAYLARAARLIAERSDNELLDPPLTLVIDEAALICKIPLADWSADFGSRGITLHVVAQSLSQMRQRFGDEATQSLLTNTATKVLFGGTAGSDDLKAWSELAGQRDEVTVSRDRRAGSQSESVRLVNVLTPSQVGQLGRGQALVIKNAMPPAILQARQAYKRLDRRIAKFQQRAIVRWVTTTTAAVETAADQWLHAQLGRAVAPVARAGEKALTWLDRHDPAREAIARVRLAGAMRRARTALTNRSATTAEQETAENTETGVTASSSTGGTSTEGDQQ